VAALPIIASINAPTIKKIGPFTGNHDPKISFVAIRFKVNLHQVDYQLPPAKCRIMNCLQVRRLIIGFNQV
jgi:hypothetical protein